MLIRLASRQALIAFFFLLAQFCGHAAAEEPRFEVPVLDSPARGPADAPVTIVEFLDYQ